MTLPVLKNSFIRDDNVIEAWPDRKVMSYEEVQNTFDGEAFAVKKTLECGHWLVTTGTFVFDSGVMKCKKCYDNERNKT